MPVEIYWLVPERVVYLRVIGLFTFAELVEAHRHNIALLDAITHDLPVHFIDDQREMTQGPTNLIEVRDANKVITQHPRLGWWVLIDENRMVRFISSVVAQVTATSLKSLSSWERAAEFLPWVDPSIPPLPSQSPTVDPLIRVEIPK